MLEGFANGELFLEERAQGSRRRRIRGKFPYRKRAVLSDGGRTGRPRKEVFEPRAFAYNVTANVDIRLLVGHDFGKPLASRGAGTLDLIDSAEALTFKAEIAPELEEASWVRDFFAGFAAGLIMGISPGFRIPPARVAPDAEVIEEEDPAEGQALIRRIREALLFELSVVTAPAYKEAELEEARSWERSQKPLAPPTHLARWRL
ncbi:MAG: HK97 family phage prohead protease [Pseudomonadota bacterium]